MKKEKHIKESEGVHHQLNVNPNIPKRKKSDYISQHQLAELTAGLAQGDISSLSRAITFVESDKEEDKAFANELIKFALSQPRESVRVGITGVPGVGKSSFIEKLGLHYASSGKKVAILAVDPSSKKTRGSILGDKTRMEKLSRHPNVYIRPSAAGESLGGVARKTRESITLCESAGFEIILIETVGVGQSEISVDAMVDFFLLLKLPGAGDELQGIKRGIIEMADLIVINKYDGKNLNAAEKARQHLRNALHYYPARPSEFKVQVLLTSAVEDVGIIEVVEVIEKYLTLTRENGYFEDKRFHQKKYWLESYIDDRLKLDFYRSKNRKSEYERLLTEIESGNITVMDAAEYLLNL